MYALQAPGSFGERVLLPTTFTFADNTQAVKHDSLPALFSIVADSAEVELYLVSKDQLVYLPKPQRVPECLSLLYRKRSTRN